MTTISRSIVPVLALLALLAACTGGGSGSATEGTQSLADARALAAETGVPVLIDFYTDW
jgi:hypothetical protein